MKDRIKKFLIEKLTFDNAEGSFLINEDFAEELAGDILQIIAEEYIHVDNIYDYIQENPPEQDV